MSNKLCKLCTHFNTETQKADEECILCIEGHRPEEHFIPKDKYMKYFVRGRYCIGNSIHDEYTFDTDHPDLIPTDTVHVNGTMCCAYCGDESFEVTNYEHVESEGLSKRYCCFCDGAEIQKTYDVEKRVLEEEYLQKLRELDDMYKYKLKYNIKKLLDKKHEIELRTYDSRSYSDVNHTSMDTEYGVSSINDILRRY